MNAITARQHEVLAEWAADQIGKLGGPMTFEAAVMEKLNSGTPYADIVTEVAKERPDLYEKYRTQVPKW